MCKATPTPEGELTHMRKSLITLIATIALFVVPNALASTTTAKADSCPTDPKLVVGAATLDAHQGGTSTATFTIPASCPSVQVSLVSYTHSAPFFTWENAKDEVVSDRHTVTFGPGAHSISVSTPDCYYQVDLVQGDVIEKLGPADSNNFYSRQNRLVLSDNAGSKSCTPPVVTIAPPVVPPTVVTIAPPVAAPPVVTQTQTQTQTITVIINQPAAPVAAIDVCGNIEGIQTQVPAGMDVDVKGNCAAPVVVAAVTVAKIADSCLNLKGIQKTVPKGDVKKAGICSPIQVKGKKIHKKAKPKALPYTP
jgi:hypothetical protein